jgi:hypothetical protein
MDTCRRCGAQLSPELAWCGRCYAPVPTREEVSEIPLRIRTQMRERASRVAPVYSRWKAGPTSFGAAGRIVLTFGVIIGVIVGYPMTRGGILAAIGMDIPGTPFMIGYGVVATIGAIYLFTRIWRRGRVT